MNHGAGMDTVKLLHFNLLPSLTLHPTRQHEFTPGDLSGLISPSQTWNATWHRHWSRKILKQLNVGLVTDCDRPEMAIGLLSPAALRRLARHVAAVLFGPQLCQRIDGNSVRMQRDMLGEDLFAFVRREAHRYRVPAAPTVLGPAELSDWESLGNSVILSALENAGVAVIRRVELKLPTGVRDGHGPLPPTEALDLCLRILKGSDLTWHSSFPVVR